MRHVWCTLIMLSLCCDGLAEIQGLDHLPVRSEVENIPPSVTNLLAQERHEQEDQSMKKIQRLVTKALAKQRKKKKKKTKEKKAKPAKKSKKKREIASSSVASSMISTYQHRVLEEQFLAPELQAKKVSCKFKDTSIRDAIALVCKLADIQCLVDGDVDGRLKSVEIKDLTIGAALHILLTGNIPRYSIVHHLGVWRVVTLPVALELLKESANDLEQSEFLQCVETIYHAKWEMPLKTRLEKLWQGIVGASVEKGVYLMFDDASKKIFFKGRHQQVEEFRRCLREVDQEISQIRIDVRVVIASKDFEESFGLEWSGVYNRRASVNHTDFVGLGPITTAADTASHDLFKNLIGWSLNLMPSGVVAKNGINIPIVFGNKDLSTKRLNLLLNAAENRSEIKTILKPCLLVNSEEAAEILVGQQLPQETRVDEAIEGKLTNVTTTQYKDIGMKIKVVPVVSPDKHSVFLDVFVENSSVARQKVVPDSGGIFGGSSSQGLLNYTIETSRSKNRVLLKSGQTTLIGGLITNSQETSESGVPLLQEIPLVGLLFKGKRKMLVDRQILIFITPTVV